MMAGRQSLMGTVRLLAAFIVISAIAVSIPVIAHTRLQIGPYDVVVGWQNEPAVVGERNALIFQITEDDEIIQGLESTLDAELIYGRSILRANINPADDAGWHSIEIIPTIRGQYALRLFGTIADLEVDAVIEPDEILPASVLEFPESQPDAFALQQSVNSLESDVQTANLLAVAGIVMGGFGLLAAVISFLRSRR